VNNTSSHHRRERRRTRRQQRRGIPASGRPWKVSPKKLQSPPRWGWGAAPSHPRPYLCLTKLLYIPRQTSTYRFGKKLADLQKLPAPLRQWRWRGDGRWVLIEPSHVSVVWLARVFKGWTDDECSE